MHTDRLDEILHECMQVEDAQGLIIAVQILDKTILLSLSAIRGHAIEVATIIQTIALQSEASANELYMQQVFRVAGRVSDPLVFFAFGQVLGWWRVENDWLRFRSSS